MSSSTPNEIADLIQDVIKDKVVCDVGCGNGTFMLALKKYAKKVIGIEENSEEIRLARTKGLEIIPYNSFLNPLPKADVYYLWTRDASGIYLKAKLDGTKGTFIFGNSIRPNTRLFLESLKAEVRSTNIPFGYDVWKVFITKL